MQITAPLAPTSSRFPVIVRPDPQAPPAADAVAQVLVTFPFNFNMQGLLDVHVGARLSTHSTRDDAVWAARQLGHGRPSIGVIAEANGFAVTELLVSNTDSISIGLDGNAEIPLALGPDPARTRTVESIRLLPDRDGSPKLETLWIRGGNTQISFDADGNGNVTFNHA